MGAARRRAANDGSLVALQLAAAVRARATPPRTEAPSPPARTSRNPDLVDPYPPKRLTRCAPNTGPAYVPAGPAVLWTPGRGGTKSAPFAFGATFKTGAQSTGAKSSCCEVRQYIMWDNAFALRAGGPPHAGFAGLAAGVWHEDRDEHDKRYGHRSGAHSDPGQGDQYYDSAGKVNQARGSVYAGQDRPTGLAGDTGTWSFKLATIDTCNGDAQRAVSPVITIDWSLAGKAP
jgi:hypothetical protein